MSRAILAGAARHGSPRSSLLRRGLSLGLASVLLLTPLIVPAGGAASPSARAPSAPAPAAEAWTGVVSVVQSPAWVTAGSNVTVGVEVANPAGVRIVSYTFCQLSTYPECYTPIIMTENGSGWYTGTTHVIDWYNHLYTGDVAGYNITVTYENWTNTSEPSSAQSPFPGLTVGQAVVTPGSPPENLFSVDVRNPLFGLSGTIDNRSTGAPVVGATVTLSSTGTNTTTTDSQGAYAFGGLLNGSYTLSVSKAGYATQTERVTLHGANTTQDLELSNVSSTSSSTGGSGAKPGPLSGMNVVYLGLGLVAIVIVVGALLLVRRRPRKGSPPADLAAPNSPKGPAA